MPKEITKQNIMEAFDRLISEHDFSDITIDMIAEQSGYSRSTVYRNFQDKYEIMNYNFKVLFESAFHPDASETVRDVMYNLLKAKEEHWGQMKNAFDSTGINSLNNFVHTFSYTYSEEGIVAHRGGIPFSKEERFQWELCASALSYLFMNWGIKNYEITAEEAADALYEMIPASFKGSLWNKEPSES